MVAKIPFDLCLRISFMRRRHFGNQAHPIGKALRRMGQEGRPMPVDSAADEPLKDCGEIRSRMGSYPQCPSARNDMKFEMEFLDANSLQEMVDLQDLVLSHLPDPEIFFPHDKDHFRRVFQHDRSVIGVRVKESLAAYSIIRIPGHEQDNLGRDIGIGKDELASVAHLQATVVHPAFRGNGLQRKMAAVHMREIEGLGFEHVCCTVSPKNPVSLGNILGSKLVIKGLRPKFGDWWRYIMYRSISWPKDMTEADPRDEKVIDGSDFLGQQNLLKEGFVGFKIAAQPDGFVVSYKRI
jgi:ribosomal protein S18 acetylase RimI-like enzyme